MSIPLNLKDIQSGFLSASAFNANNTLVEQALEKALNREGGANNAMEADLDIGLNDINNVNNIDVNTITVDGTNYNTVLSQYADEAEASATAAATSETKAATSETNAATSETNAATSETNAENAAATIQNLTDGYFSFDRNVTAPNDTTPAYTFSVVGVESNIDLVLSPKGEGAITASAPDNTSVGGDKRGVNAVDFQVFRTDSDDIAVGDYSVISGGKNNRAFGFGTTVTGGTENRAGNSGSVVCGGQDNNASGLRSSIVGGYDNQGAGNYSSIIGGNFNLANGDYSSIIGGNNNLSPDSYGQILSSRGVESIGYSITAGVVFDNTQSTANRTFEVKTTTGNMQIAGTFTQGTGFSDYAEFFENETLGVIPYGTIVTRVGRKVKPAQAGDRILGVVSATAGVILGDSPFAWKGRYLKGEFGEALYETVYDEELEKDVEVLKQNPEYNTEQEQLSRKERPEEWSVVGMVGQVYVRVDNTVTEDTVFISATGSHSEDETRIEFMEMSKPYDNNKGYGIAICLIR